MSALLTIDRWTHLTLSTFPPIFNLKVHEGHSYLCCATVLQKMLHLDHYSCYHASNSGRASRCVRSRQFGYLLGEWDRAVFELLLDKDFCDRGAEGQLMPELVMYCTYLERINRSFRSCASTSNLVVSRYSFLHMRVIPIVFRLLDSRQNS